MSKKRISYIMQIKVASLKIALIPIVFLVLALLCNFIVFNDEASSGPNQMALLGAAMIAGLIGVFKLKMPYKDLERTTLETITLSAQAVVILLIVGTLIGLWILSGVVPSMIYYGIQIINPTAFLPVSLLICSIVSVATGSSWSTVGTVGIALIGIGKTLGIPEGIVAGAIVSGSYFGDKMSPLSDTTNLAPAMAGTDLFSHIRHMIYTTGPAFLVSLILFIFIGFFYSSDSMDAAQIEIVLDVMQKHFNITPWLFILPIIVFVMVIKKVPAIPALLAGTALGGIFALLFQSDLILELSAGNQSIASKYGLLMKTAFGGFAFESGNEMIDKLFNRGGMSSMLTTVWMIMMAMVFGGMMEATGLLQVIANKILSMVRGVASLVASTIGSAMFLNLTTSDQYISIVVTGRMFKSAYQKMNLQPKNLSRALEDGATVTSVLVPWNTCGAYFSTIMGVATLSYLPFAFFNYLSPLFSIIIASTGKTMEKIEE
jgi:Na+:H+ antiporter, NhaC family